MRLGQEQKNALLSSFDPLSRRLFIRPPSGGLWRFEGTQLRCSHHLEYNLEGCPRTRCYAVPALLRLSRVFARRFARPRG